MEKDLDMKENIKNILLQLRNFHGKILPQNQDSPIINLSGTDANELIKQTLLTKKPCMIARFGNSELQTLVNYLEIHKPSITKYFNFITNRSKHLDWHNPTTEMLHINAGFFPKTPNMVEKYCQLIIEDIPQIDILGSWIKEETKVAYLYSKEIQIIPFINLEPYYHVSPWSIALEDKKVLVISPFEESIKKQYKKREVLFKDKDILPSFELKTIKAIQTVAGNNQDKYNDWFEALEIMKQQINNTDFDIAIIGCGAYGMHLAAHIKRIGKKGFHLGGATQILFGILGDRWINSPGYKEIFKFPNEHWIKPSKEETPKNAHLVEGATYW